METEILVRALTEQFGDRGMRIAAPPNSIMTFPAAHPDVGDARIWQSTIAGVTIAIGDIHFSDLHNIDHHLDGRERAHRLTRDVVRFFDHLFADRLFFWKAADSMSGAWRECADAPKAEPLVMDDCRYLTYVWSWPLGEWRASTAITTRGRIRDEREYELCQICLQASGPENTLDRAQRALIAGLIVDYERAR